MKIIFTKSNWELSHLSLAEMCDRVAAAGYAATETNLPNLSASASEIRRCHEQAGLKLVAQMSTQGATVAEHLCSLEQRYLFAIETEPLFVNSQTSRDFFSLDEHLAIFEKGQELVARYDVPLRHETHRSRALYSVGATMQLLRELPELELTADFSHWVCVHESDLSEQTQSVERAMQAARHIHARVGYDEGPQVSDPRNPAYAAWMDLFLNWWQRICDMRRGAGDAYLTITPEFGPEPYMPLAGINAVPVADAWDCNLWMKTHLHQNLQRVEFDD